MIPERKTGIVWSYRLPEHEPTNDHFRGDYATRHKAIGHATILARLLDLDEWEVRWHESMWTKHETPTVCDHCGHEEHYMPLVKWTFDVGGDPGAFCSDECYARHLWEKDPNELREYVKRRHGTE